MSRPVSRSQSSRSMTSRLNRGEGWRHRDPSRGVFASRVCPHCKQLKLNIEYPAKKLGFLTCKDCYKKGLLDKDIPEGIREKLKR